MKILVEKAVIEQALKALEVSTDWDVGAKGKQLQSMKAITALREALAEQAEQEPVALLQLAADALVYHTEQTRPIQNTIDALAAIQKFKEKQR